MLVLTLILYDFFYYKLLAF